MLSPANLTDEKLKELLSDWDKYFNKLELEDEWHDMVFSLIMGARISKAGISIVAPVL